MDVYVDPAEAEVVNETVAAPPRPVREEPADDDEKSREEAFDEAPRWNGKLLEGWSLERDRHWRAHRCAVGAPPLERALDDWHAFTADAIRILYFASHDPAEFVGVGRDPGRLEAMVVEWGVQNVTLRDEEKARMVAMRMLAAARKNMHETAPPKKGAPALEGN